MLLGCFFVVFSFKHGNINIASLNVNGARDCKKRAEILNYLNKEVLMLLLLQETHSDEKNEALWAMGMEWAFFFES